MSSRKLVVIGSCVVVLVVCAAIGVEKDGLSVRAASVQAQPAADGGEEGEETAAARFFKEDSSWYTRIPEDPALLPNSAEVVEHIVETQPVLSGHNSTVEFAGQWSVPVWHAREDTPETTVPCDSAFSGDRGWNVVPIPPEAVPAGNDAAAETPDKYVRDGHMVIVSHDRKHAWDFWKAVKRHDGGWQAGRIRKWDLTGSGVEQPCLRVTRTDGKTTLPYCRVGPVPLLHGLVMYDEVVEDGRINHALAFATENVGDKTVYPCVMPWESGYYGYRFQLDPSIDVDTLNLNNGAKVIARALQEYGMIFVENNGKGCNSVYLESLDHKPETWTGVVGGLKGIPLDRMRVVEPVYPDEP